MKKLNLGCGKDIKEGWDNFDLNDFDLNKFPYPLEKNYYDYVLLSSVIDYLENPFKSLVELGKHCKKGAIIEIYCAYWNCKGAYNTLWRSRGFSEDSFKYSLDVSGYNITGEHLFEVIELNSIPTKAGRFIYPGLLRKFIAKFLCGIIGQIHVKLKVV